MVCRDFILSKFCKPCLSLSAAFQFVQLIVPYQKTKQAHLKRRGLCFTVLVSKSTKSPANYDVRCRLALNIITYRALGIISVSYDVVTFLEYLYGHLMYVQPVIKKAFPNMPYGN